MENRNSADDVDDVAKASARAGIQEHDFAEEFSSDLPSTAMPSSAPSGSSPYASLSSPSAVKVDDRDVAHGAGRVGDTKKLEHELPSNPRMQLPAAGFRMVDSMGRPPVVYASNSVVGPGTFPVRSARNTATSRTFRSPAIGSYASPREFTNEESKQEDGVPNSAAAGIGVYAVEAQRVPDGNEDGTVLVAEARYVSRMKWYQRRWIVAGLALLACGFAAAVVVLVVRPQSASSSSSLTPPPTVPITGAPSIPELTAAPLTPVPSEDGPSTSEPTTAPPTTAPITTAPATPDPTPPPPTFAPIATISPTPKPINTALPTQAPTTRRPTTTSKPTSLTSVAIACNFLSLTNVTMCQSRVTFESACGESTTGSTIPSEIGLLTNLNHLDLDNNYLSGAIPSEIGLLSQLTLLRFDHNQLSGTIPSEIGLLTKLAYLDLTFSQLTGTIPSSLCSHVTDLWINCGGITCQSGCCKDYTSGSICGAPLTLAPTTGTPRPTPKPTPLTPAQIACNFLGLSNVTKCRSTVVWDGTPNGSTIPSEIGLLTQLTGLDFGNNWFLSGAIPSEIGRLTKLNELQLFGNQFAGAIPSEIGLLTELTTLRFDNNLFSGTIPSEIGLLTQLNGWLDLYGNDLSGTIPSSLCSLSDLTSRIFIDCGEITCQPGCCLSGDSGSPCGAPPTPGPTTGTPRPTPNPSLPLIPAQIACNFLSLSNVTECRSTNRFEGTPSGSTIPSEIGLLTQLTFLYLYYNELSSRIPSEIGLLTKLTNLDVSDNSLSGTIPSEFGLLTQLNYLSLYRNQLSGVIPTEIGLLTRLDSLHLYENQLSGTIPSSLCSHVTYLDVDCGEISCQSGCCKEYTFGNSCG